MLSPAPRFCVTRPHEFFESVALLEILRTNDKSPCVCEDTVRKGHAEFGEKKKGSAESDYERVLWKFFRISLPTSRLELSPRPSDITREFPPGILSWGGPRNVVIADDGNIGRMTVEWGILGISPRNTLSRTCSRRNNRVLKVSSVLAFPPPLFFCWEKSRNWKHDCKPLRLMQLMLRNHIIISLTLRHRWWALKKDYQLPKKWESVFNVKLYVYGLFIKNLYKCYSS